MAPAQAQRGELPPFINPHRDRVGEARRREDRHGRGDHRTRRKPVQSDAEYLQAQPSDQNEQADAKHQAEQVGFFRFFRHLETRTCTPRRATFTGSTVAPSFSMIAATRSRASGSTRNRTQPPPPAPQTFAANAPLRRVTSIMRSIRGVEMPGAFFLRCDHSSRNSRAASVQSCFSMACRMAIAIAVMVAKFLKTCLFPSMW